MYARRERNEKGNQSLAPSSAATADARRGRERGDERLEGGSVETVDGDVCGARAEFDGGRDARGDGGGIGARGESETEEVRNRTPRGDGVRLEGV